MSSVMSTWRLSGVICDRRTAAKMKGNIYKIIVRPAVIYGLEVVALTKRGGQAGDVKMTIMDEVRGTAKGEWFRYKVREAR